ncbi:MAG: hypothetical protein OXU45_06905 [Candidatus Melainabacteria bacterium]|nr:hypothetical protein [Candidatus Melainabacteria bacterium]
MKFFNRIERFYPPEQAQQILNARPEFVDGAHAASDSSDDDSALIELFNPDSAKVSLEDAQLAGKEGQEVDALSLIANEMGLFEGTGVNTLDRLMMNSDDAFDFSPIFLENLEKLVDDPELCPFDKKHALDIVVFLDKQGIISPLITANLLTRAAFNDFAVEDELLKRRAA